MSTMGYYGLGNYLTEEVTPDWYRNERYEYCEPFSTVKFKKEKNSRRRFHPLHLLLSLFA